MLFALSGTEGNVVGGKLKTQPWSDLALAEMPSTGHMTLTIKVHQSEYSLYWHPDSAKECLDIAKLILKLVMNGDTVRDLHCVAADDDSEIPPARVR